LEGLGGKDCWGKGQEAVKGTTKRRILEKKLVIMGGIKGRSRRGESQKKAQATPIFPFAWRGSWVFIEGETNKDTTIQRKPLVDFETILKRFSGGPGEKK